MNVLFAQAPLNMCEFWRALKISRTFFKLGIEWPNQTTVSKKEMPKSVQNWMKKMV